MNDKAFEKMMAQKRIESEKPGYGARCAAKARWTENEIAALKQKMGDKNIQELILS